MVVEFAAPIFLALGGRSRPPRRLLRPCAGLFQFGFRRPLLPHSHMQVDLARTFNEYGLDLCLCDVDTVWINGAPSSRCPAAHATLPRPGLAEDRALRFAAVRHAAYHLPSRRLRTDVHMCAHATPSPSCRAVLPPLYCPCPTSLHRRPHRVL